MKEAVNVFVLLNYQFMDEHDKLYEILIVIFVRHLIVLLENF